VFLLFIEPVRLSTWYLGIPRHNAGNRGHTSTREAGLCHTIPITFQVFQDLAQLTKHDQQQRVGLRVGRRQTEKRLQRTSSSVEFRYISQHISYEYLRLE